MFIVLTGQMGSGKSDVARSLEELLRERGFAVRCLNPDQMRFDVLDGTRTLGLRGEERERVRGELRACFENGRPFPPALSRLFYREVERELLSAAAGDVVVIDSRHPTRAQRDAIVRAGRESGHPVHVVWLDAPPDVLRKRLLARTREENPVAFGEKAAALLDRFLTAFEAPLRPYVYVNCAVSKDADAAVSEKNALEILSKLSPKNNVGGKNAEPFEALYRH